MAFSIGRHPENADQGLYSRNAKRLNIQSGPAKGAKSMSLGTILVIILIIFLLGGFSGRFGGYGYGYGHGGIGIIGIILIILIVLLLTGRL
jgi:Na+/melibiose symporter-like transporter